MPRQPRRTISSAQTFSALSTRRSSYPTWIIMFSSSFPYVIKVSDVGNRNVVQALLNSDRVLPVPHVVNDIAESLSSLFLRPEMLPLAPFYGLVTTQLLFVCDFESPFHISPNDAHRKIILLLAKRFLKKYYADNIFNEAMTYITRYVDETWGTRINFAGFENVLLQVIQRITIDYRIYLLPAETSIFFF